MTLNEKGDEYDDDEDDNEEQEDEKGEEDDDDEGWKPTRCCRRPSWGRQLRRTSEEWGPEDDDEDYEEDDDGDEEEDDDGDEEEGDNDEEKEEDDNKDDGDDEDDKEDHDGSGYHQLLWGSPLVGDGWDSANDDSNQSTVGSHPSSFSLGAQNLRTSLLEGSIENETQRQILPG